VRDSHAPPHNVRVNPLLWKAFENQGGKKVKNEKEKKSENNLNYFI